MIGNLIVNGVDLSQFGLFVTDTGAYNAPVRNIDKYSIKGRNGDIILDNGNYNNITVQYPALMYDDFENNIDDFRDFITNIYDYVRISDTFHPDEYRMGRISREFQVENLKNYVKAGKFTLTFDCKPQRFLVDGDNEITISSSPFTLTNPTRKTAKPIITVYGAVASGSEAVLHVGDRQITFTQINEYAIINSEIDDCYKIGESIGEYVSVLGHNYPILPEGDTTIEFEGGITSVVVQPKWWRA